MKVTYIVEFWAGTDLRCHREVETGNELAALAIAIGTSKDLQDWTKHDTGFQIRIRRKI